MTTHDLVFQALSGLFSAVLVNGNTGEVEELNESFSLLTGWKRDDLRGEQLDNIIPKRSQTAHHEHVALYMQNPTPRPMGADREVYLSCKDGSEVLVWIGLSGDIGGGRVVASILPMDGERPGPLNPKGATLGLESLLVLILIVVLILVVIRHI